MSESDHPEKNSSVAPSDSARRQLALQERRTEISAQFVSKMVDAEARSQRVHQREMAAGKQRFSLVVAIVFMLLCFLGVVFVFAPLDLSRDVLRTIALILGGGASGGAGGFYLGWRAGRREAKRSR